MASSSVVSSLLAADSNIHRGHLPHVPWLNECVTEAVRDVGSCTSPRKLEALVSTSSPLSVECLQHNRFQTSKTGSGQGAK
jgi:hypothetical protein